MQIMTCANNLNYAVCVTVLTIIIIIITVAVLST